MLTQSHDLAWIQERTKIKCMKTQPKVHESSQAKLHMNHRMYSLHPKVIGTYL